MSIQQCPLCASPGTELLHVDQRRPYLHCAECGLVHVPGNCHISVDEERRRYDLHRNDASDAGYRRHLGKLHAPLSERLERGAVGLDFGSGPGPVLSMMFEEAGYPVRIYDPHYAPDISVLASKYDFVTSTEVVEHFTDPAREWARMTGLLRPRGWLGIMTRLLDDGTVFADWYYKNDPTHVCFYRRQTMDWLARRYRLDIILADSSVVLMRRAG